MKKKTLSFGMILLLVGVAAAATGLFLFPYEPLQPPSADDSGWTEAGVIEVVNANNQFAFDLYYELSNSPGNIFYSPYSISSALAMTYEGAKGETAEEIKSVFHFPEDDVLRPNFAAIYNNLNKKGKKYELRTGNALWVQYDFPLLEVYTSTVDKYYAGKVANLDFVNENEKSRVTINDFIELQTNKRIKDLIPAGMLSTSTRLVITNAIYFKGDWIYQFDKSKTVDRDFMITPQQRVTVPMMIMNPEDIRFNYAYLENLQILELPYKGEDVSMLIILPSNDLESIESEITLENLALWKSQMVKSDLDTIQIPKFEFDTKYFMKDVLSLLGMPISFSGGADFSGMTGGRDLFIGEVIHQAFVKVDEEGTEAAAATAVVMRTTAIQMPRNFIADHPFIFLIQEKGTGNILFMGRVVDPTQK